MCSNLNCYSYTNNNSKPIIHRLKKKKKSKNKRKIPKWIKNFEWNIFQLKKKRKKEKGEKYAIRKEWKHVIETKLDQQTSF